MILSILICHLSERAPLLEELQAILKPQLTADVEVLIDPDTAITTGAKRNALLARATGSYTAFVDDDDRVSNDYVRQILKAVETGPDVVGMRGLIWICDAFSGVFEHSIRHETWSEDTSGKGARYLRPPNHLNPVRRELALKSPFPDISIGEDQAYSMALRPLLKTEVMIERPIYQYFQRGKTGPDD